MTSPADRAPDLTYDSDVTMTILAERERQRARWSAAHDYGHSQTEWTGLLGAYVGRFAGATSLEDAQQRLTQVAALCVAAIEAIELTRYGPNPAAALNALDAQRKRQEFAVPSKAVLSVHQGDPPIDPTTLNEPQPPTLPDEDAHLWQNVESYHVTTSVDDEGVPNLTMVHVVQCMICGALWRHL